MQTTEMIIEQIVGAVAGSTASRRQTHYLRESLRHLVRATKSAQARDVGRCVALSIGLPAKGGTGIPEAATRQSMGVLLSGQGKFDFETNAPE